MHIIRYLLKISLPLFLIACISSLITGICSTLIIKSIHQIIKSDELSLNSFIIQFSAYWIIYGIAAVIATYSVSRLTQEIVHQLRIELSYQILNSDFKTVENNQSRLFPILTEDIRTISYAVDRLPSVVTGLATVIGLIIYMFFVSYLLSLCTLAIFIVAYIIIRLLLPLVKKYADKTREAWNQVFTTLEGVVFGIKELTLNEEFREVYLNNILIPESKNQNKLKVRENLYSSITSKTTDLILLLGIAILIIVIVKTSFVELSFFGQFLTLVLFTISPLSSASGFLPSLKKIDIALNQVEKAGLSLDQDYHKINRSSLKSVGHKGPLIKLNNITHSYFHQDKDENFTLGPIELEINENEILFISGGNGSGKTTLSKIIIGLYSPENGSLLFNDQEIKRENMNSYRSRFSALFNNSYLFDQLIHINNEELEVLGNELINLFHLSKKVSIENKKFTTKKLSQGQTHRLSLITAILENKSIYLFDEWAANQDPIFKKTFYKEILPMLKSKGKTVIVVSHDDQYYSCADRVLKLVDGKVFDYSHQILEQR
ncbi:MAG: cyclic peptide export ABC transporter [Bacteroidota bacterium]